MSFNPKYPRRKKKYKTGYYFSSKNNKSLHYRSSYELLAYHILEINPDVKSYSIESLRVQYYYRGQMHYCVPDILVEYIDDTKHIIEVKAERFYRHHKKTKVKISAMQDYAEKNNYKFSVWYESVLVEEYESVKIYKRNLP